MREGYSHLANGGYSIQPTGRGTPLANRGYPRVPPHFDWMEVPSSGQDGGTPCQEIGRQSSYAAGGMPLAFTQEDFLVISGIKNTHSQEPSLVLYVLNNWIALITSSLAFAEASNRSRSVVFIFFLNVATMSAIVIENHVKKKLTKLFF